MVEFIYRQSECREHIIDVSVGGALIAIVCHVDGDQHDLPFQVGDVLEDVELVFPSGSGETRVKIKKAIVVRFDQRGPNTTACCGLEFIEIEQNQVNTLTEFIYKFQRDRLRNRLRPDL
jgi:c-di-GMP-binding flagellar brake protein YcgR